MATCLWFGVCPTPLMGPYKPSAVLEGSGVTRDPPDAAGEEELEKEVELSNVPVLAWDCCAGG